MRKSTKRVKVVAAAEIPKSIVAARSLKRIPRDVLFSADVVIVGGKFLKNRHGTCSRLPTDAELRAAVRY